MAGRTRPQTTAAKLRQLTADVTVRVAIVLMALAVTGEAGHLLLDQLNLDLAHHVFHILFPLVAFMIFGTFVAWDIRKHGWPRFSWRLQD